ncbi:MAG: homoserine dehydrogenase [Armatimonadetes bacterium]|nr:homoserine dehydrogenase [Armatimonadota bacterium]
MPKDVIKIGLLGCGQVGSGTVAALQANAGAITQAVGARLEICRICVRNLAKPRPPEVDRSLLTVNPDEVLNDPEIDLVAELIGGVEPARRFILQALDNGKHIVTANKELIAKAGHELLVVAGERRLDFSFEGSVAGGIPIIRSLKVSLAANRIEQIIGIVNGTTNYILTRMAADGLAFAPALAEAQARGYAEADPSDDVDGRDAAYKLAILASIGFQSRVDLDSVYCEGIRRISDRDIRYARELGYVIKLLAIAKQVDGALELRVHPAMLPVSHPLAAVSDVFNAIFVRGNAVGDAMFYGRGAGSLPTGSSVVADLMETARNIRFGATGRISCTCFENRPPLSMEEVQTKYYVRMTTADRPGVLAATAGVFGDHGVSIESMVQKAGAGTEAEIVWITHGTHEGDMRQALAKIERLPVVREIGNWIRVEE